MTTSPISSERESKKTGGSGAAVKGCGCLILFVVVLIAFIAGMIVLTSLGEETTTIPGDASHFDPVAQFNEVQRFAGLNAQLYAIDAYYVRSDGTMDLTANGYNPFVRYDFYRTLDNPPADAPPVGAGGTVNGDWYEPVEVEISRPFQMYTRTSGSGRTSYMNLGMDRDADRATSTLPGEAVSPPQCSFAELWQVALQQDAPPNAVAIIQYDSEGYEFNISDADIFLDFNPDCELTE